MMRNTIFFLLLLATPLAGQAIPGLDGRLLRAGTDTFLISYAGQQIGVSIQSLELGTEGGRPVWRQGYLFRSTGGDVSTDTLVMDAATLAPLVGTRRSSLGDFQTKYGKSEVTTLWLGSAADSTVEHAAITEGVFASSSLEAIARSLPLAEGYTIPLTLFYGRPSDRTVVNTTLRVTGSGSSWVVTAGPPGETMTLWIDKRDRTLLKFDTQEGEATITFRRPGRP